MLPIRLIGARAFIVGMALGGAACMAFAGMHWQSNDPVKFACYVVAALLASSLKVTLPGIEGTLSVNFLFTLLGILELGLPQTLVIGLTSTLGQFYWRPVRKAKPVQLVFNLSQVTVSSFFAYEAYQFTVLHVLHAPGPLALLVAAITHYGCNTAAMATIIGLTEDKPILKVWTDVYLWSFPYYMVGAAIAGLIHFLNGHIGWQSSLLVLPPVYLMYRSYRLYLGKLETEKKHAEQVSSLHLRTIEALALAIEAKDENTGEHLQRVRVYCTELAKDLGLTEDETEALRAASVLHDIGKLAVPEHIISKPGRLTPDEFEKMKIHPIVGAEILERVNFPYPVVPIVRSHHEKWDGTGYPDGLAGEAIPIGARILTAVDCFDALASDRQYRKALPIEQAIAKVVEDGGKAFDPRVVKILQRRYIELEKLAKESPGETPAKLSTEVKVERGSAPDAGFVVSGISQQKNAAAALSPVQLMSQAKRAGNELAELHHLAGKLLRTEDLFSLLDVRLQPLVPHEALGVFVPDNNVLVPKFVTGQSAQLFSSLRIPVGEGLCGWVAQNHKAIVNGNPAVEPGYLNDAAKCTPLRSALAVPIEGTAQLAAVLALYRIGHDAFSQQDLRLVQAVTLQLGKVFEAANIHFAAGAKAGGT